MREGMAALRTCEEDIVIVRIATIVAVLAGFVLLGTPWSSPAVSLQPTTAAAAPADAPAATSTNGLQFSSSIDSEARPINPRVEFGSGTHDVWVSFNYRDHDPNADLSYLVRANGEDYKFGKLNCCPTKSGRYAFALTSRGGGDLPGASYDVRIYANGAEIAHGGFGVNGRGGLDNDGQGDNGNGNDNGH
jgi:hypothetical protein